jgi:uncharacterized protein YbjT (DUF2867 family)
MADQGTVVVAGATGFLGRHIATELIWRGRRVVGIVRDLEKARAVLPREEKLRLVKGDAADSESLRPPMEGAGAVVNTIGILREGHRATFQRQHVVATRNLVDAAAQVGGWDGRPTRFVQVSALGVSDDGRTEYLRSKFESEMIVRRSGLAWTILRPSLIHGLGSEFLKTAKGWITGTKQPFFFLPYFARGVPAGDVPLAAMRRESARIAPVAVEDVAWAAAESLERPESVGEVINLAGPEELSWPEMLRELKASIPDAHEGLQPLGIPAEIAAVQAKIAKAVGLGSVLPFDEGMAIMGAMDSVASADKARALLGFSPRPFRESLRRYAAKV